MPKSIVIEYTHHHHSLLWVPWKNVLLNSSGVFYAQSSKLCGFHPIPIVPSPQRASNEKLITNS